MKSFKSTAQIFATCAFLVLAPCPLLAQGTTTITFDGPPAQPPGTQYGVQDYEERGVLFTPLYDPYEPGSLLVRSGGGKENYPENGTPFLQCYPSGVLFRFKSDSFFGLLGLDVAGYNTEDPSIFLHLTGYRADGSTVSAEYQGTGINWRTLQLGPEWASGLTRVEIPGWTDWSIDNIVLSVPEPGTGALAALGLGFLGYRRMRRRNIQTDLLGASRKNVVLSGFLFLPVFPAVVGTVCSFRYSSLRFRSFLIPEPFRASASWQVTLTDDVNVTNDLLLIYNTNSPDSKFVKDYYRATRPNVAGANVLGIGCPGTFVADGVGTDYCYNVTNTTVYESITPTDYTNQVLAPVLAWLAENPTKQPQYVILFLDVPSRISASAESGTNYTFYRSPTSPSVSYSLRTALSQWRPYITHINMNGTNDCVGYINKLASLGSPISSDSPVLSAGVGYSNTNYMLDGGRHGTGYGIGGLTPDFNYCGFGWVVSNAVPALTSIGVGSASIYFNDALDVIQTNTTPFTYISCPKITAGTNVAGYMCWGAHSSLGADYAIDGKVKWSGNSGWWVIETVESFNGQRYRYGFGTFMKWFSSSAFGGTNYSNTPVGGVTHTDEPYLSQYKGVNNSAAYFGRWEKGRSFGVAAWESALTSCFQAVGDPLIKK